MMNFMIIEQYFRSIRGDCYLKELPDETHGKTNNLYPFYLHTLSVGDLETSAIQTPNF